MIYNRGSFKHILRGCLKGPPVGRFLNVGGRTLGGQVEMVNNFYLDVYEHQFSLKMKYNSNDLDAAIDELYKMKFEPERAEIVRSAIIRERNTLEETSWFGILRYSLRIRKFKREKMQFFEIAIAKLNHYIESYSPLHRPV